MGKASCEPALAISSSSSSRGRGGRSRVIQSILRGKPNSLSRGAGAGQPSGEGEVPTRTRTAPLRRELGKCDPISTSVVGCQHVLCIASSAPILTLMVSDVFVPVQKGPAPSIPSNQNTVMAVGVPTTRRLSCEELDA